MACVIGYTISSAADSAPLSSSSVSAYDGPAVPSTCCGSSMSMSLSTGEARPSSWE